VLLVQTDILQTNKILRDVSRGLGADWRPVFESLMAQFPEDVRHDILKKVEAERPFMQAYKALMMWKEASGPDFNIRHILNALRNNGLTELEQMTLNILDSESLFCIYDIYVIFMILLKTRRFAIHTDTTNKVAVWCTGNVLVSINEVNLR